MLQAYFERVRKKVEYWKYMLNFPFVLGILSDLAHKTDF